MSARGLELSDEAAPVLWGRPPVLVAVGFTDVVAPVAERERVAEVTVEFMPAEAEAVADAAAELRLDFRLAMTDEAEAAALEAADEAEAMAEDREPDPPVRPNWPE